MEHLSELARVALLKYLGVTTGREKDFKEAAEHDQKAEKLIEETGYFRRRRKD